MDDTVAANGSFDGWYRAEHPRLLGLLTVVAGDAELAADVTAEAFTRALERWDRVVEMESPSAWTYRVGVNLVRRRLRRAAVESRLRPDGPAPAAPRRSSRSCGARCGRSPSASGRPWRCGMCATSLRPRSPRS